MKLNGRLAERRDRVKRRWDLSVKAQANCAAQVYGRLISWDGLKSRIATIIDMQQAAFYKLLQLDAVMLFAVFGSEGSACPPLSREAQITVWIDLWTNYLEFSHWIVDLLKPSRIKVKINSSKLLFSGRRARVLRAVVLWPPQRRGGLDTILPRKSRCFAPFIRKQGHIHHPSPLPFTVLPAPPDGREPPSATHPPPDVILIIRRLSLS